MRKFLQILGGTLLGAAAGALVGIVRHAGDSPVRFLIDLDPESPADGASLADDRHLQDDPYKARQILAVSRRDQTRLITAVDASLALLRRHCEVGVGPPERRLDLAEIVLGPSRPGRQLAQSQNSASRPATAPDCPSGDGNGVRNVKA